jgi:hypothetical protein
MDRPDETIVSPPAATAVSPLQPQEVSRLRDLSPQQWKSGIAAWLGWLFDGLDMHLYVSCWEISTSTIRGSVTTVRSCRPPS